LQQRFAAALGISTKETSVPHNRAKREQELRNQFSFVVFNGEYSVVHAALAVVDVISTGGTVTLTYLQEELGEFGQQVAAKMIEAGVNPVTEPLYAGVMTFQNWETPIPGWKVSLPNKFVPYVAARRIPVPPPVEGTGNFKIPILQVGTALHETNGYFDFSVARWSGGRPDLFAIKKRETGSGKTEVHILSGGSNFSQFVLQTGTALGPTDNNWNFFLANWSGGKPDLIAISRRGTSSPRKTEIHILSGESNFQEFLLQTKSALNPTDDKWDLAIGNWTGTKPDLFAIKRSDTGTGTTEVHILSGESNFSEFVLQTGTALGPTDDNWKFRVGNWSGTKPDLFAISRTGTSAPHRTEVHILSGESNYGQFILQEKTALRPTDDSFDFELVDWDGGRPDLMAIKKHATGTRRSEVHIFKG
jgi:hypothetical protein